MIRRLGGVIAACLLGAACGSSSGVQHQAIPPLAGHPAIFDQALVDQSTRRLYIADEALQAVDVFDTTVNPPRYVTSVKLGHPPHGLAAATDLHKVFVGMDGGGVAVIEANPSSPAANRVLAVIQTKARKNVDLVDYQPDSHVLWGAAGDDGFLFRIDAIRNLVLGSLTLGTGLEQPRYDKGLNLLFLNDSSKNEILAIDPDRLVVTHRWPVGVACQPSGMGIDESQQVAVLGCLDPSAGYSVVWDLRAGRRIRTLADINDADQVIYDAKAGLFMAAGQGNGVTAIGFFGGSPVVYQALQVTHADSRAVAYDEASQTVYTPDAKAGSEGLVSFPLPKPQPPAPPLLAPLLYLVPLLLVGLAVWYYGRRRARERQLAGRPMYS